MVRWPPPANAHPAPDNQNPPAATHFPSAQLSCQNRIGFLHNHPNFSAPPSNAHQISTPAPNVASCEVGLYSYCPHIPHPQNQSAPGHISCCPVSVSIMHPILTGDL